MDAAAAAAAAAVAAGVHRLAAGLLSKAQVPPGEELADEELSYATMIAHDNADLWGLLAGVAEDEYPTVMHLLQGGPAAGNCAADGCGEVAKVRGSLEKKFLARCDQCCHILLKPDAWPETFLQ